MGGISEFSFLVFSFLLAGFRIHSVGMANHFSPNERHKWMLGNFLRIHNITTNCLDFFWHYGKTNVGVMLYL